MNKSELLRWLTEEQQKWELLLAAIGERRMDQSGVNGDWSMRDIVAHLTGWQRLLVAQLQAAGDGRAEPPPPWSAELTSEDDINAWIYQSNRTRTVHQILDDAHDVHQQLLTTIQGLPEDSRIETIEAKFHVIWVRDQRFAVGEFFHHFYDDHAADVLAWLRGAP
ncbi:MAG: ClbS/DfsB family four-helix bundle protein [Chloroflexi bacterium AL-W]|nr:ClbS/DfsB family four-helix bundle protein [Chloroflexi bacterium AL-N1]NOK68368.1 ClbS/DfsB family four-helix bundle protein [Chloroflexi bacterium AL-N10]NOK74014.1 ClbS/DfsB family four-helix bundle protein [Chloroflexi bacterium AL-N5]NOK82982.1 ClbS/DfsB family four-helix bundle protein [Chloroflexi bacterium AL-W]NOK90504.1 ClbS/DfsB family four-helix bundle protein [Chloroflexi bacterium AL-N15]